MRNVDEAVRMVALTSGATLALATSGSGPVPMILVHGYSMSLECWDRIIGLMPPAFTAYRYDLRGFGRSGRAAHYTLEDHAVDLAALMATLGLSSAVLVGHSLGANVVQIATMRAPAIARALVLANARSLGLPAPDRVLAAVDERIRAYGTRAQNHAVLAERIGAYFDPRNVTRAELDRFLDLALLADTAALRQTLDALYAAPPLPPERFAAVATAVLLVCGETDAVTPTDAARPNLRLYPDATLVTIADAGHSPMWEKPESWASAVFGFLQRRVLSAVDVRT